MDVPSLLNMPRGCSFHPRCPLFVPGLCDVQAPLLTEITIPDVGGAPGQPAATGSETCTTVQIACHVVAARQSRTVEAPMSRGELERLYGGPALYGGRQSES
jgi:peptide/nickel transport system ATP-binding protein